MKDYDELENSYAQVLYPYKDNSDILELIGKRAIINNNKLMNKFEFLSSTRFWALVIGAVMYYLQVKGIIGEPEMVLANTILGGFITIKTIDRASEQKVLAAEAAGSVTTVTMPESVSKVSASTEPN